MMKKNLIQPFFLLAAAIIFLAGCIDDHYGEDKDSIAANLTGYAWERIYQIRTFEGRDAEVSEHYEFKANGRGFCKITTVYADSGEKDNYTFDFQYLFITPNNRYIFLDNCYWQIDRINSSTLDIYETTDNPVITMGQSREYKSFSSVPLE